jgi:hypothetical protein
MEHGSRGGAAAVGLASLEFCAAIVGSLFSDLYRDTIAAISSLSIRSSSTAPEIFHG